MNPRIRPGRPGGSPLAGNALVEEAVSIQSGALELISKLLAAWQASMLDSKDCGTACQADCQPWLANRSGPPLNLPKQQPMIA